MTVTEQVDVERAQRRSVGVLSASQLLGGIAIAGSVAAGALLAESLGGEAAAGLAQTAGVLGAALLALPLARLALTRGRRPSLALGYGIGAVGAVVVVVGGSIRSLVLVLLGCLLVGVASAAGYQARYGATDLAAPEKRGRALSTVVWAATIGAVLGPNLLQASGTAAAAIGLPELTGPYLLAALVLLAAVVVLVVLLRPDPYLLARHLHSQTLTEQAPHPRIRDGLEHLRGHRLAILGITAVAIGHVVMVMVMVMTPVHMAHVDVSLQLIGLVISVHVVGMYALSPLVGWTVDRFGRVKVILLGCLILAVSCAVSALAAADDVVVLGLGLFLLGLGWSCTLIAGSTLLTDDVAPTDRPSVQGFSDLMMNVAGALGGAVAGVIVMVSSYAVLCAAAAVPVAVLVVMALPLVRRR